MLFITKAFVDKKIDPRTLSREVFLDDDDKFTNTNFKF